VKNEKNQKGETHQQKILFQKELDMVKKNGKKGTLRREDFP
jgi:phage anti-repressor protein